MNTYQHIFTIDKASVERLFSSNDVEKICYTMVAIAFYEQDGNALRTNAYTF